MPSVNLTIDFKILAGEGCGVPTTYKMVSVYDLDENNKIRSERPLYTECPEVRELVNSGDLSDSDCYSLRPSTVSSSIGCVRAALMKAIQNNDCRQGGSIVVTYNSKITTINLNNKQDCILALKELNKIIPSYPVYSMIASNNQSSVFTTAFDMCKRNALPFFLGAVSLGLAAKYKNHI